jgi:hypothetical protein
MRNEITAAIDRSNGKQASNFCPVIKDRCRCDCISFIKAVPAYGETHVEKILAADKDPDDLIIQAHCVLFMSIIQNYSAPVRVNFNPVEILWKN